MTKEHPCQQEDWFVPHATTITLPDGRKITVDGIPYEGWGTTPGKIYRVTEHDDEGNITSEVSWAIPSEPIS